MAGGPLRAERHAGGLRAPARGPARERIRWLVEDFLADSLDELGTRLEAEHVHRTLEETIRGVR